MAVIDQFNRPIITGTPAVPQPKAPQAGSAEGAASFLDVLKLKLEAESKTVFSKHAVTRVHERQIDVSQQNLERLDQGMQLARQKGLRDALILIDEDAYIVSVDSQKVVTVDGQAQKGSVFTNIDGTVIV